MASLARWCVRHRLMVVLTWLAVLVATGGLSHSVGARYANNFSLPATDSSRALTVLQAEFHRQSGDVEQVVFQSHDGPLSAPSAQATVRADLAKFAVLPHVAGVVPPGPAGSVSQDGLIGFADVYLDEQAQHLPASVGTALADTARAVNNPQLTVAVEGRAVEQGSASRQPTSMALGVLLSLIVLFFAFRRSFLCALLPIISALAAIGVGTSIIGLLTHAFSIPQFGPILATLVALGVGVDYALFIVSRHRSGLLSGLKPEDAAVNSLNTSGRAVFFAGVTVCIALLGMFALQVSFLYGVALSAALVVALTMVASLTLLPAMLGFFGMRALRRGERAALAAGSLRPEGAGGFWERWSASLRSNAALKAAAALGVIVVIALPFFSMRQGLTDAGEDPSGSTTRQAYDLLAQGFGPGYNGPLELVALTASPAAESRFAGFVASLDSSAGVRSVTPAHPSPDGRAAVAIVYPTTSPQSAATSALLQRIRSSVERPESGGGLVIHVGGVTASQDDFASILSSKMPQFVAVVVVLAFLLLALVFRTLVVPLVASVMNLLSIGAALGVLTAVFQWGWGRSIIGFARPGPIEVFLPVMLFAILFGLSMDYEVFLVSRIHEEWVHTADNDLAVGRGLAGTGRVITAAATIMILVFVSFIFGGQLVIKEFGLGFAAAIFLDAFVIRTVLVPTVMYLLGRVNWWLPDWLDRRLPVVHVEPGDLETPSLEADRTPVPT